MQPANALLPGAGFATEKLLAPRQALVAFFSRVRLVPPSIERVSLDDAFGRVLARDVYADGEYPNAARSAMDGFAVLAAATPGEFAISGEVRMGQSPDATVTPAQTLRIPTGGVLPAGTDAVVPIEEVRVAGSTAHVAAKVDAGSNVVALGADMHRGETVLKLGTRIGAPHAGVLAALGVTVVDVYRRPVVAVLSSGDELVAPSARPNAGQVRDSNRYAIAASLRAMGAQPRHFPKLSDEADVFERGLASALRECDAVAISGGSSVGERDRLPAAAVALGPPGVVVHGLRLKPGKPTLLAAVGEKPILGLPGNPTSALMVLEAVVAPIVAALVGAPAPVATTTARLAGAARSRAGWTWYLPVELRDEGGSLLAHPLPLRSFSVSLTARAQGYLVMDERDEEWPAGTRVTVHRFLGT
ncbi:MAG: molybdopterin molybdotransferase MoeA [Candidatus Tumulicola sp.]